MSEHVERRDQMASLIALVMGDILGSEAAIYGGNIVFLKDSDGIEYSVTVNIRKRQKAKLDALNQQAEEEAEHASIKRRLEARS